MLLKRTANISNMTITNNQFALAADIGGTNIRAALVDTEGHMTGRGSINTEPDRGIEDASDRLSRLLNSAKATADRKSTSLNSSHW